MSLFPNPWDNHNNIVKLQNENARLRTELDAARTREAELRNWLDNNTIHYDVDYQHPVEGVNMPVLQIVTKRIWYHATNDQESWPFSMAIDAALAVEPQP